MSLEPLRRKIDALDKKIVGLLNARAGLSRSIGDVKRAHGQSVYSPDRERQVLQKIAGENKGPLSAVAVEAIYREIMSAALSLGEPLGIAYLGPEATFTHSAALARFGSQVEYMPCASIGEVFLEVEKGNADYGVIPVENSIEGAVTHTLDMFLDSDLKICAQVLLEISHNLLSKYPKDRVKRIYSIPQVFGQCRIWLQSNLHRAELVEVSSTTRGAQIAAKEKNAAAIASSLAAKVYGLRVIAKDIQDFQHNITRFMVIGKTESRATGADKTSIVFSIKDRVGALHDMLAPFRKYGINLTKIESRPSKKKAWAYYFFIDLQGHRDQPRVRKALAALEKRCSSFKILGSYPIGE